jgi:XapX domain-containing protein
MPGGSGRQALYSSWLKVEMPMRSYLMSLGAGVLVGVIYNLIDVRSPAPPVIALVGLLGILIGEQIPPIVKSLWRSEPMALSWFHQVQPHVFGHLPKGQRPPDQTVATRAKGDSP